MAQHSRFGGSAAARFMACPGSVALLEGIPDPGSAAADEGTWAHAIGAYCLQQKIRFAEKLLHTSLPFGVEVPNDYHGKIVDVDTAAAVQVYLDAVWAEMELHAGGKLLVEQGFVLDIDGCDPGEVFGTNDALVYHPHAARLVVFDYKHGRGMGVDVEDNAQLKFYAAGAVFSQAWPVKTVELVIVQPRLANSDADPVKRWTMPTYELVEFLDELSTAINRAKRAMAGPMPPDFKAGLHCDKSFCNARGTGLCPAYTGRALEALKQDYASVVEVKASALPDPKTFDAEGLGKLLQALPVWVDWLNQVQQYAEGVMLSGVQIPGFKVVEKIGRRKWVSADEDVASYAELMFGLEADVVRPRKLATLTEVEKQLKAAGATKEQLDDFMLKFTLKESSGRTIAPASDRRPAVDAIASDFGSVKLDA
jgi:hypothetical protein